MSLERGMATLPSWYIVEVISQTIRCAHYKASQAAATPSVFTVDIA